MGPKLISILLNTDDGTFNLAIVERKSNRIDGVYYSVDEILLADIESNDKGCFLNIGSLRLINNYKKRGHRLKYSILSWDPDSCEAFPINPGTKNFKRTLEICKKIQ